VDQTAPTWIGIDGGGGLAITGIDIQIIRYQSGRVIADNGTVTIQTGDTDAPENWVFGMTGGNGSITFPDNTIQTTAYPGSGGAWSFGATAMSFPDNTVQTTAYTPKYKVYTALLTQSGNRGDVVGIDSGELEIGVTYYINQNSNGDFTNVGAPNNTNGTYFVATGTTPNDWGIGIVGGDKLTYVPDAPVATVLDNTIGNIWWIYNANRQFSVKSNNLFTDDKTILFIQGSNDLYTSSSITLNNLYFIQYIKI
jgi:hypothetical protein